MSNSERNTQGRERHKFHITWLENRDVDYVCMVNQLMFQTVETFLVDSKNKIIQTQDPKTIILYRVGADIL